MAARRPRIGLTRAEGDRRSWALDTVARQALAQAAAGLRHQDWPELSEADWAVVARRVRLLAPHQRPGWVIDAVKVLRQLAVKH